MTRTVVQNERIVEHADRVLAAPKVARRELALDFAPSVASSARLHVEGRNFYPPLLADIASASSSVHINQFGFRPGLVGDRFAAALVAKAHEGVPVRLIVDRQGTDPERGSREFYEQLTDAGIQVCVARATQLRAPHGPLGGGGAVDWNVGGLGHIDHRKAVVVDGRIGWVGGAGIEDHFDDGRFHDLFVRLTGPVISQLQLVFLATFRWLGGAIERDELDALLPAAEDATGSVPATVLHNAPGRYRPITTAIAEALDGARETLDVVNPYVTDRRMIGRIEGAARRGVKVRLFVPATANNWACAAAQRFHHEALLDAGVRILGHPAMLHAKAFVRDREDVLVGTCNLDAWSLRRFFEINVLVRSPALAVQLDERFLAPAEAASSPGRAVTGALARLESTAFAAVSPLL
jgi:cardiolipin synthase A/B